MLSLGSTVLRSNLGNLRLPYKLNFAITYWCQSRCLTCNIWQIKPKGELSLEEIQKFAEKNNYFKWVGLTGGEPFLRSDIVDIVDAFKKNFKSLYMLTFPTNSLCDKGLLEKRMAGILDLNIPKVVVTVSLDGSKELHDKIRGVQGNYEKAIMNYKMLQELSRSYSNLYYVFGYTLSRFNAGQFKRTLNDVKNDVPGITPNDFHINIARTSEHYYQNNNDDISPDRETAISDLKWVIRNREYRLDPISRIEHIYTKGQIHCLNTGKNPTRSRGLDASLYMDSFGNVYPSITWNKKVGNIKETDYSLEPIWHGREALNARREIKEGKEPNFWTSCEAYQAIIGDIRHFLR